MARIFLDTYLTSSSAILNQSVNIHCAEEDFGAIMYRQSDRQTDKNKREANSCWREGAEVEEEVGGEREKKKTILKWNMRVCAHITSTHGFMFMFYV